MPYPFSVLSLSLHLEPGLVEFSSGLRVCMKAVLRLTLGISFWHLLAEYDVRLLLLSYISRRVVGLGFRVSLPLVAR